VRNTDGVWAGVIRRKFLMLGAVAALVFLLAACSSDEVPVWPSQTWKGVQVAIESRPTHITAGMTEFLVLANVGSGGPAHDLMVSLRIGDEGRWIQAIQDGHVGVYRRALVVTDPKTDVLAVYLRKGSEETVLHFPLSYSEKKP